VPSLFRTLDERVDDDKHKTKMGVCVYHMLMWVSLLLGHPGGGGDSEKEVAEIH